MNIRDGFSPKFTSIIDGFTHHVAHRRNNAANAGTVNTTTERQEETSHATAPKVIPQPAGWSHTAETTHYYLTSDKKLKLEGGSGGPPPAGLQELAHLSGGVQAENNFFQFLRLQEAVSRAIFLCFIAL